MYGARSKERLASCHPELQLVFNSAMEQLPYRTKSGVLIQDIGIIEGHRNKERQNYLFDTEKSQLKWPQSNHNSTPSNAIDALPYHPVKPHYHWADKDEMEAFAKFIIIIAERHGVHLRWGGDWDEDGKRVDKDVNESFFDGPHFERVT
jgi:peptidoglycan L-alanyl-D-glutamate endopeptidase CwlK